MASFHDYLPRRDRVGYTRSLFLCKIESIQDKFVFRWRQVGIDFCLFDGMMAEQFADFVN